MANASDNLVNPEEKIVRVIQLMELRANESSGMHFNKLNDDCIRKVFEAIDINSLQQLVTLACTCEKWLKHAKEFTNFYPHTSLKLLDHERNHNAYQMYVINEFKLHETNGQFRLVHLNVPKRSVQDYLILRPSAQVPLYPKIEAIERILAKLDHLTISSISVDYVKLLQFCSNLCTLTLLEPPFCTVIQGKIWAQLESMAQLRHLHIFHLANLFPLNVDQLRPVLARLNSFTLAQYKYANILQLLGCLDPANIQELRVNSFSSRFSSLIYYADLRETYPAWTHFPTMLKTLANILCPFNIYIIRKANHQASTWSFQFEFEDYYKIDLNLKSRLLKDFQQFANGSKVFTKSTISIQ